MLPAEPAFRAHPYLTQHTRGWSDMKIKQKKEQNREIPWKSYSFQTLTLIDAAKKSRKDIKFEWKAKHNS